MEGTSAIPPHQPLPRGVEMNLRVSVGEFCCAAVKRQKNCFGEEGDFWPATAESLQILELQLVRTGCLGLCVGKVGGGWGGGTASDLALHGGPALYADRD